MVTLGKKIPGAGKILLTRTLLAVEIVVVLNITLLLLLSLLIDCYYKCNFFSQFNESMQALFVRYN